MRRNHSIVKGLKLTKRESVGLFGLLLLCTLTILIRYSTSSSFDGNVSTLAFEKEAEKTIPDTFKVNTNSPNESFFASKKANRKIPVNINRIISVLELESKDWISFGFSQKMANRLYSYCYKNHYLRSYDDLKSVYGIEQYNLEVFRDSLNFSFPKISLNKASELELERIKGIGPKLSARIVKYRTLLNGFYSVSQLKEVYGLSPELFSNIKNLFELDSLPSKRYIGMLSYDELVKHPYFEKEKAKQLMIIKKNKNKIRLEELDNMLSPESIDKLTPYFH